MAPISCSEKTLIIGNDEVAYEKNEEALFPGDTDVKQEVVRGCQ